MHFKEILGKQLIFADGAMGTQLQEAGLAPGAEPTLWNITHPDAVLEVHKAYLEAGATYVTTNTFGANALKLAGEPFAVDEVVAAGVQLARTAVQQQGNKGFVALGLGPLGQLLRPLGSVSFDEAYELFACQVKAGVARGVDCILIETMIDTYELKAAVLAAKEHAELPVLATVALNEQGRLLNGADLRCICVLLEGLGVDALGLNCGAGPQEICGYAQSLQSMSSLPLIVCPNAGMPVVEEGQTLYTTTPELFARQMKSCISQYTAVVGGCCGTTPAHIQALVECLQGTELLPLTRKPGRWVSSSAASLDLEASRPLLDRRLDASADPEFAEALRQEAYDYAIDEVFDATSEGAQIIGVSAAAPAVDEATRLPALIEAVQEVTKVPLLISSAQADALEQALRIYNGCALVDLGRLAPDETHTARLCAAHYGAQIVEE